MMDERCFAMHWLWRAYHTSTVDLSDSLVSQTHPQNGIALAKGLHDLTGETRFVGRAWTWRDNDLLGMQLLDLVKRDLIVAPHHHVRSQFGEVLVEVIGKAIVVINQ